MTSLLFFSVQGTTDCNIVTFYIHLYLDKSPPDKLIQTVRTGYTIAYQRQGYFAKEFGLLAMARMERRPLHTTVISKCSFFLPMSSKKQILKNRLRSCSGHLSSQIPINLTRTRFRHVQCTMIRKIHYQWNWKLIWASPNSLRESGRMSCIRGSVT